MASRLDKEKGVNVQVLLRCRPFNDDELRSNAPQVVTCRDHQREVAVSQNIAGKQHDRVFTFDKVFGPQSLQKDLYDQAIVPIVNEVLEGFNCTIFAYGQTGTGKTYTMEGAGRNSRNGELPQEAGVIPRAIKQIFDTLEMQNAEYSVKVTFLELYNEETTDLLAPDDISKVLDDRRRPLSLMEDGKGGVIVRGLEEVIVTNSIEIFNLLDRGSAKRRTAETLLNKQSSRSHSIFSITIHIKEATAEGEELMKCGKLNLVDLAGSENICRSGAREGRAREAGEINKSLLTLGRVITSLVEHLGHVPYRDSKLTRLLRDSLGGRTKTCIIATVSPSVHCLEETMSTLDYAQRAKSIKNKPEVNQKLMKTTLIKELYGEIDRLKTELHAAREKNGVYIPQDRFYQDEADKKAMAEKIERVENELVSTRKLLGEMQSRYELEHELCSKITTQLDQKQKDLEDTKQSLLEAKEEIQSANHAICEKEEVIMSQQQAESLLIEKTNAMRSSFEQTILDVNGLFSKIERKKQVETGNLKVIRDFQAELLKCLNILRNDFAISLKQQQDQIVSFDDRTKAFLASKQTCAQELKAKIEDLKLLYFARLQGLFDLAQSHENTTIVTLDNVIRLSSDYAAALQNLLRDAVLEAELVLQDLEGTLLEQQNEVAAFAQQQREGAHTTLMATKEIAKATLGAFDQLAGHANELSSRINDCSQAQEHSLAEFERNFQEQARQEEEQMLQDIATLLTNTRARKTALVHGMVSTLRDQSAAEKSTLQDGIKEVRSLACVGLNQWGSFLCRAEATSAGEVRQLAARHCQMEALIQKCIKERHDVSKHWASSQNLVEQCARSNLPVIESAVREAQEYCGRLQDSFEQEILAADVEMEVCRGSLIVGTEVAFNLENDMEKMIQSTVSSQLQGLVCLGMCHDSRVEDVQRLTTGCLEDVREDQPTNMTPTRRDIYVLSRACIEDLHAATADVLIRKYQERMGIKENGVLDRENITGKPLHHNEAPPTRIPLARLN